MALEQFGYSYKPGIGGINFTDLTLDYTTEQLFNGGSGRPLGGLISPEFVSIRDLEYDQLLMYSRATPVEKKQAASMSLSIYTRSLNSELKLHPDFKGREFIEYCLKFYRQYFYPIRSISCNWLERPGEVNAPMYWAAIDQGLSEVDAAKQTWTGRVLSQLSFTKVGSVVNELEAINQKGIQATFYHQSVPIENRAQSHLWQSLFGAIQ